MNKLKNISVFTEKPTEQQQEESFFQSAVAFEEFVLKYGKYHLNNTLPEMSFNKSEFGEWNYLVHANVSRL